MSIQSWLRGSAIATAITSNLVLGLTTALAQTNRQRPPRNVYEPELVDAFKSSCEAAALDEGVPEGIDPQQFQAFVTNICSCTIWEIQDRYTANQFVRMVLNEEWTVEAMNPILATCTPS